MKKVLFVLAVILLTACGESATAPAVTTDTTFKQDSLTEIPTVDAEKAIDTAKEVK